MQNTSGRLLLHFIRIKWPIIHSFRFERTFFVSFWFAYGRTLYRNWLSVIRRIRAIGTTDRDSFTFNEIFNTFTALKEGLIAKQILPKYFFLQSNFISGVFSVTPVILKRLFQLTTLIKKVSARKKNKVLL